MLSWVLVVLGFFLKLAIALYIVLSDDHEPTSALAWLLVVVFLPGIGIVLYLFLGRDLHNKRLFKLRPGEATALLPTVSRQKELLAKDELYLADQCLKPYQNLVYLLLNNNEAALSQNNSIEVLDDGEKKFARLFNSIQNAREFIHLQYFIIRNDNMGQQMLNLLTEKAKTGVEVKVLYDGMGSVRLPKDFFRELRRAGGSVAAFFPPSLKHRFRLNFRNHRKICVIDGQEAYMGGFNIGNEYISRSERFSHWRDLHLRISGDAVDALELRFLQDWRLATGEQEAGGARYFPEKGELGTSAVQIASSGPDSRWQAIKEGLIKMILMARDSIYLETPYFIPDESLLEALKVAALSGVKISVITPGNPDHPFVYWAGLSFMGKLLPTGVRFFHYQKGFLHSKLLIIDGCLATVGTANFDVRSFRLNFEVNAFIYDTEVAKRLEETFHQDLKYSSELTLADYKRRSKWTRAKEAFSRLLSPLL